MWVVGAELKVLVCSPLQLQGAKRQSLLQLLGPGVLLVRVLVLG